METGRVAHASSMLPDHKNTVKIEALVLLGRNCCASLHLVLWSLNQSASECPGPSQRPQGVLRTKAHEKASFSCLLSR